MSQSTTKEALAALERLIASDDAHSTIHAPDDDDVARMIEYSAAFDNARAVVAKAKAAYDTDTRSTFSGAADYDRATPFNGLIGDAA